MKNSMKRVLLLLIGLSSVMASSSFAQYNLPPVVADASQYLIRSCEVRLNVDGRYNQLFVNQSFAGNFQEGYQDQLLAQTIYNRIQNGTCSYKSNYEVQIMRDPRLIQDFINRRYQNCFLGRSGNPQAYELYVYNQDYGSYFLGVDDLRLRSALANYVATGVCVGGPGPQPPIPPNPPFPQPQGCTCTLVNQWGSFSSRAQNCNIAVVQVVNECANSNPQAVCAASQARCF